MISESVDDFAEAVISMESFSDVDSDPALEAGASSLVGDASGGDASLGPSREGSTLECSTNDAQILPSSQDDAASQSVLPAPHSCGKTESSRSLKSLMKRFQALSKPRSSRQAACHDMPPVPRDTPSCSRWRP